MAVRLRLRRVGRKKFPIYKVVAADKRSPRDGRFIEAVGQYEPLRDTNNVEFNEERVMYWLNNGAQPSTTVKNLLSSKGLWLKWSLLKKGVDESTITEKLEKFAIQQAEREQEKAAEKKEKKKAKAPEVEPAKEDVQEKQPEQQEAQEKQSEPVEDQKAKPVEQQKAEQVDEKELAADQAKAKADDASTEEQKPEEPSKPEDTPSDEESSKKE